MSSADAEAALQQLGVTQEQYIDFKDQQQTGRRLLHACLALLLWDYIITLKDEVDDVWKRAPRFSLAKVLFALNRYYPIITYLVRVIIFNMEVMTPFVCKVWIPFTGWSGTLNFAIVEVVLFLRVWALYDKSKKVGIFLVLLFVSAIAVTFALRRVHPDVSRGLGLAPLPPASLLVCKRSTAEEYFFLYFIAMLVETIVFGMLINKAWASSLGRHETPLINALLRHGTVYYAAVLFTLVFAIFSTSTASTFQPVADSNLIVAIASIACNRLILSLRGFYFQRGVVTTTNMMTSPSFGGAVHIKMDRLNRERTSRPHIRGMTARRSSQPRNDTFDRQLETVEYRGSAPLQDDDTVVVSGVSAPSTSSQPSR